MSLKTGIITALSAIGLFAGSAAHAQSYYYNPTPTTVARPVRQWQRYPRYRWAWNRGRYTRRPVYVQPVYQYQAPAYQYEQNYPAYQYQQPRYDDGGCNHFVEQSRAELRHIEQEVRARVQSGQLDGSALTTVEEEAEHMERDLADLSAKGYLNDADRAHIQRDLERLRSQFGC